MIRQLIVLILCLFVPFVGYAADGDRTTIGTIGKPPAAYRACALLCDTNVASETLCDEFDVTTLGGIAQTYIFEIITTTGCSSTIDIDINTNSVASGAEHDVTALNTTVTRSVVHGDRSRVSRYISAAVTNDDDCTVLDVLICADFPAK